MYTRFKIPYQTWIMFMTFTFWWKANFQCVHIKCTIKYVVMRKTATLWAFGNKDQTLLNFHFCCRGRGFEKVQVGLPLALTEDVDILKHRTAWKDGVAGAWEAEEGERGPGSDGRAVVEGLRSSKDGERMAGEGERRLPRRRYTGRETGNHRWVGHGYKGKQYISVQGIGLEACEARDGTGEGNLYRV